MTTATTADLAEFALLTKDTAWIKRHGGMVRDDGYAVVKVPVAEVAFITWQFPPGPQNVLRHRFADCPKDFPNPGVVCFGRWVPETEARFADRFQQEGGDVPAQFRKGSRARQAR